ncbi:required for meiotic nuclear division protein 1 [Naviculisporaceae sp. PSN 640]
MVFTGFSGFNGMKMKYFPPTLGPAVHGFRPRCLQLPLACPPRPVASQRTFHQTGPLCLPRRRNFFTSNVFLQKDGTEPPIESRNNGANSNPSQKRRKPPLKNSLHRVAIVAQKGVPSKTPASPGTPETPESDGSSTISAVCVAESFDMDTVASILTSHGFSLDPDGTGFEVTEVVHARALNKGDIFVFPSGTIVTWSLPSDVGTLLATKHLLPAAESPFVADKEVEDLEFVTDPEQDTSRVNGDVVVLGTRREVKAGDRLDTTLAKIAFSSGLARSTKLAVLESSLTRYLESTRQIPEQLSQGLRAPLSRELILQKTGELLNLRSQLNHYNDLTDALPDLFWDSEERLETYYSKIGKALDVGVRIKTLNDKMTYAQEVVNVAQSVVDISEKNTSEAHSTRLEWIIIILIAIEVCFELRRVYLEGQNTFEEDVVAELNSLREELGKKESGPGKQS